jgi:ParB family transcriptional regulator, chromosome partitioning protein
MSPNPNVDRSPKGFESAVAAVVPQSTLKRLKVSDIKPNPNNPRMLFDKLPLNELKENIRLHGVLVPITVYEVKGQNKYAILDGERRYRCCVDLEGEGIELTIPANIVDPPDKIAGILYMFSIHNFREQWELMPTALSLQIIIKELGEDDTARLSKITGLSDPQIERCKILLGYPKKYQDLSLEPDPVTRIPSNFWIEAYPVLNLAEETLPTLSKKIGRDGITDNLIEKYQAKQIKSVIHFRRIIEAYDVASENKKEQKRVVDRLAEYITDVNLETRKAFDEFVVDNRRIQGSIKACDDFVSLLKRSKLEHALDKDELIIALRKVREYIEKLLQKLEGNDRPDSDKKIKNSY